MNRQRSILLHLSLLFIITSSALLGLLWLQPQDIPQSASPAIIAAMEAIQVQLYDTDYHLYANLTIDKAQLLPKKILSAKKADVYLQDKNHSHIKAEQLWIEPLKPWRFYRTHLQRNHSKCSLHIRSSYLEYDTHTRVFHTPAPVTINMGHNQISMQGIDVPTQNKKIFFGSDLKGSIDPLDICTMDFNQ